MILPHVSASQIQTYRSCPRLWSFTKVHGEHVPQRGFQTLGQDIHAELEAHLLGEDITGDPLLDKSLPVDVVNARLRAQTALHLLPPRGAPGLGVEAALRFPMYAGGPDLVGYSDLVRPPRYDAGGVIVGIDDHKTTSDFRWAKTEDDLRDNVQMMIYAYWAFQLKSMPWFPLAPHELWRPVYEDGVDLVELAHNYIRTKGALVPARRVAVTVGWPHVAKQWAGICSTTQDMVAHATAETPVMDVPGNGGHCRAYGGCHFRDRCPEASQPISLSSLFRNAQPATIGGVTMPSTMDDLKARLAARMSGGTAQPPAADAAPAPAPAPTVAAVLPPDAPPRVNDPTPPAAEAPPADAAPEPAKKRGRPPKAAAAPAPTQAEAEKAAAPTAVPRGARVLYINSRPRKGVHVAACYTPAWEIWMAGVLRDLHTELKTLDYRLVEFGRGRGALNAFMKARLGTAPEVCIVNTLHPEAQDFLAIAIPEADDVTGP